MSTDTETQGGSAEDRLAELERLAAQQAHEIATLRRHDRTAAEETAQRAPRITSPAAKDRETRDLEAIRARREAMEEHVRLVAEQEERDAPTRAKRDAQIEELREKRDAALARADEAYAQVDELAVAIAAVDREPISPPIPLPACLQTGPIASMGTSSDSRGVYISPAARAKLERAQAAKLIQQGARR